MNDEDLADHLLELLVEFGPALSIEQGEDDDQVIVEITMDRTPDPTRRRRTQRARARRLHGT